MIYYFILNIWDVIINQSLMEVKEKQELLRFIGMKVPTQKVDQAFAILQKYQNFPKVVEAFKTSSTQNNEDYFINLIKNKHEEIMTKTNDNEIIMKRDSIFSIRAINPSEIISLTQRAFFNSFNLQRNNLNDLNQDPSNRQFDMRQERKRSCCEDVAKQKPFIEEEEQKCICGKVVLGAEWVQCIYEDKCRGSNWYHMQCAGFTKKDMQKIKDTDFVCDTCKREVKEDESGNSSRKRRKND